MAKKNQQASVDEATDVIVVAFMLVDHTEGEDGDAVVLTAGQRIEVSEDTFAEMAKEKLCERGVYVTMLTGIEGGKYSLKPHDNTWLAPSVYEAWKTAGYCEPTADDPSVAATLQARADGEREAVAARDAALIRVANLESGLQAMGLELAAAREQALKVKSMIEPEQDSGDVLGDETVALLGEVVALVGMFPEPDVSDPELNLK
ncbi:hypothetical protein GN241_11070 [Rhodobacteraceae bacterium IMCC1335]